MNEGEKHLHPWIDPELGASIVALILGEASDFEAEKLKRLIEERPELAAYRKRMESIHGLLREVVTGKKAANAGSTLPWRLSDERRKTVLEAIGIPETGESPDFEAEPTEEAGEISAPSEPITTLPESAGKTRRRWRVPWRPLLKVAAVLAVLGILGSVTLPVYHSATQLNRVPIAASESASRSDRPPSEENFSPAGAESDAPVVTAQPQAAPSPTSESSPRSLGLEKNVELYARTTRDTVDFDSKQAEPSGTNAASSLSKLDQSISSFPMTPATPLTDEIEIAAIVTGSRPAATTAQAQPQDGGQTNLSFPDMKGDDNTRHRTQRWGIAANDHDGIDSKPGAPGSVTADAGGEVDMKFDGMALFDAPQREPALAESQIKGQQQGQGLARDAGVAGKSAPKARDMITITGAGSGAERFGDKFLGTLESKSESKPRAPVSPGQKIESLALNQTIQGGTSVEKDDALGDAPELAPPEMATFFGRQRGAVANERADDSKKIEGESTRRRKVDAFQESEPAETNFDVNINGLVDLAKAPAKKPALTPSIPPPPPSKPAPVGGKKSGPVNSTLGPVSGPEVSDELATPLAAIAERKDEADFANYRNKEIAMPDEERRASESLKKENAPIEEIRLRKTRAIDKLKQLNEMQALKETPDREIQEQIQSYELGYRMQSGSGVVPIPSAQENVAAEQKALEEIMDLVPRVVGGGSSPNQTIVVEGKETTHFTSEISAEKPKPAPRVFGSGGAVAGEAANPSDWWKTADTTMPPVPSKRGALFYDLAETEAPPRGKAAEIPRQWHEGFDGETSGPSGAPSIENFVANESLRSGANVIDGDSIDGLISESAGGKEGHGREMFGIAGVFVDPQFEKVAEELNRPDTKHFGWRARGTVAARGEQPARKALTRDFILSDEEYNPRQLTGSRYGATVVNGDDLLMITPEPVTSAGFVQLGFRDKREAFAANRVAPPSGLEEKNAAEESFSTFSLHVSDVSFKLAQAALAKGEWPEAGKVRIEEFVNALDYGDPNPSQDEKVACRVEQAIHPFLQQRNLMRVAMRTAAAGRAGDTPLRLTFLLDNSGSMERADREETVRRAFALLADQLQPIDQVTLISFARQPRLLADKVSGDKSGDLVEVVANLPSEGGTNLEAALKLAFEKAQEQKVDNAQNRIVLLTDGAANLGNAKPESLAAMIESMREEGIAFDAAGIGADGLNDEILEALTRKGDGRYYLLDRPEDADDGFARQIAGALRPAAKNVKVQVEFNPDRVGNYKLLGFEKHRLKKEDFRDDSVDAAEMAAEEAGVAVYQFEAKADGEGDVGFVSVRFRDMSSGKMVENRWPIPYEPNAPRPDQAAPSMQLATAAALLAAKLNGEPLGETVELDELARTVSSLPEAFQSKERVRQLRQMIEQARELAAK